MDFQNIQMRDVAIVGLICIAAAISAAIALLVVAAKQIRDLDIPEDADFFETMRAIPITVPIALDLLDLGLDFFAAPVAWIILEMLGLGALKAITIIEAIIPGTNLIPTMTIAWAFTRLTNKDRQTPFRRALREQQLVTDGQYPSLQRGGSRADYFRQQALPPGERSGMSGSRVLADGRVLGDSGSNRRRRSRLGDSSDALEGEILDEDDDFLPGGIQRRRDSGYDDDYDGDDTLDDEALG
jgi:hypothetical protein